MSIAAAAKRAVTPSVAAQSAPGAPNINPATGLSTDYLNHFTEAVMALEMAGDVPECLDDLRAWRPKSYVEHFTTSRFSNRDAVIRAYRAGDPATRQALEAAAHALNAAIVEARDAMPAPTAAAFALFARRACGELRPMIASMAALINGSAASKGDGSAQAEIDAMFGQ
jgi:hypothetical protein